MKLFTKVIPKVEEKVEVAPAPQEEVFKFEYVPVAQAFSYLFKEGVTKEEAPVEPKKLEPAFASVFKEVEIEMPIRQRIEGIDTAADVARDAERRLADAAERRKEEIRKQEARMIRRAIGPA